jgi:putative tryptophan/tyrosine transport system substrate-binding protein
VINRRTFLAGTGAVLLAAPLAAEAQPRKVFRIGFLSPGYPYGSRNRFRLGALQQGLRELGFVEGQNISIETWWAEGKYERLPGLAAELVRLKVNVIVTYSPPAIQAAKQATGTIPIVMAGIIDPVATGFVACLARPGGEHHRSVLDGARAGREAVTDPQGGRSQGLPSGRSRESG